MKWLVLVTLLVLPNLAQADDTDGIGGNIAELNSVPSALVTGCAAGDSAIDEYSACHQKFTAVQNKLVKQGFTILKTQPCQLYHQVACEDGAKGASGRIWFLR